MKRTILLIVITAWLLIPTGTPDDIIAITLMKYLGAQMYLFLVAILLILMLKYKLNFEKIGKMVKKVIS